MEKPLPQITLIRTYSQDFIMSNMYFISKVLFNTNNDNTKKCISFLSSGGFSYYNKPDEKKTLCPIVLKNRSQILKYLNEFFIQKNKQLQDSITSYEQNAGIVFFPIHYMQPISVTPVYIVYKSRKILQSWDIFYKIEISAFKNVSSGKTELCNLLDRGISITISTNGIVSCVKYNLLPFSHISKDEMYKVHNEIGFSPQIVYLLNTDNNLISPFYLSLSERKLIPASKQSFILQEQITEIFKNPMEFNENRVVVWLGGSNNSEVSGNDSNSKSFNIPPPGAKLIRLKPKSEYSLLTPCLYWWNGQYQFGDFLEVELSADNLIVSEYVGNVLQNEIEHLCFRLKHLKNINKEFKDVISFVTKKRNYKIDKKKIYDVIENYRNKIFINVNNKPETIDRIASCIKAIYNPSDKFGNLWFDEVLILPLSENWFIRDDTLNDRYLNVWRENGALNNLVGGAGAYLYTQDEMLTIKNEILYLKSIVKTTTQKDTPEALWLDSINQDSLNSIKRIIFISEKTWHYSRFQKYADWVGVNVSFSVFNSPPLLSVILHEFSQGDSYYYDNITTDPHIKIDQTKAIWSKISLEKKFFILQQDPEATNQIYQANNAIALISLAILLKTIDEI